MSQENVEVVQASFAAIARGDLEELLELYDPDIQFLPLTGRRSRAVATPATQGCATISLK